MPELPLLAAALLLAAASSSPPAPTCGPVPVPAMVGWQGRAEALTAVSSGAGPFVRVGRPVKVALPPAAPVRWAHAPTRKLDGPDHGGLLRFAVPAAGTYQIALSGAAWIEVIGPRGIVASSAHQHGPSCSGIRKIVRFRFAPGTYVLQLSGSADAALKLLVARP